MVVSTPELELVKVLIPGDEFLKPICAEIVPSFTTVEPAPPTRMTKPEGADRVTPLEIVIAQLAVDATETEEFLSESTFTGQVSSA